MACKVLVVDDEPSIRNIVRFTLELWEIEVQVACSGYEGIHRLERDPELSIVITDINMPGMNGYEFARKARKLRPDLPLIALSGLPHIQHELFDAVVKKPVKIQKLKEIIDRFSITVAAVVATK